MMLRGRAPLVVAVVLLVGLVVVVVQRGRAMEVTSPFDALASGEQPFVMAQTADAAAVADLDLGRVCAPAGRPVTIRGVRLYGVSGSLRVAGIRVGTGGSGDSRRSGARPIVVTEGCGTGEPESFSVQVVRPRGESAHADGVEVTYETDGRTDRVRLARAVTLCRQLSEC